MADPVNNGNGPAGPEVALRAEIIQCDVVPVELGEGRLGLRFVLPFGLDVFIAMAPDTREFVGRACMAVAPEAE